MSAKSTAQIDAKREEFRKYLEKEGILESLTKTLVRIILRCTPRLSNNLFFNVPGRIV